LGRREMHGVIAAELVVMREHAGSRREDGRHADPIEVRPEAFEFSDRELQPGVRQPPITPRPLERRPRFRVHQHGGDDPAAVPPRALATQRLRSFFKSRMPTTARAICGYITPRYVATSSPRVSRL